MQVFTLWLRRKFEEAGLRQCDFARAIGVRDADVHGWLQEGRIPRTDRLVQIAEYFGVSVEEMMGGERPERGYPLERGEVVVTGMAGADTTNGSRVMEPNDLAERYRPPEIMQIIRVSGHSMDPIARDGQYVEVAPDTRTPRDGDIVVAMTRTRGMLLKKFFRGSGARIILQSVNPLSDSAPIEIEEREIRTIRVVVAVRFE